MQPARQRLRMSLYAMGTTRIQKGNPRTMFCRSVITISGTIYDPPHSPNFCGLPGQFCHRPLPPRDDPIAPAAVEADFATTAIAERAPQMTAIYGTVYNHFTGPNFCGLPGMFCPPEPIRRDVAAPNPADTTMITAVAGSAMVTDLPTMIGGNVPSMPFPSIDPERRVADD